METITIRNKKDFIDEVKRDWMAIDRGLPAPEPVTRIYFESAEALSRVLTRQRHILLKTLHANGAMSVRALAAVLGRDYKNVHQDVAILEESGLIERDSRKHIMSPNSRMTIELNLAA